MNAWFVSVLNIFCIFGDYVMMKELKNIGMALPAMSAPKLSGSVLKWKPPRFGNDVLALLHKLGGDSKEETEYSILYRLPNEEQLEELKVPRSEHQFDLVQYKPRWVSMQYAVNKVFKSAVSPEVECWRQQHPLPKVSNIRVQSVTEKGAEVLWNAVLSAKDEDVMTSSQLFFKVEPDDDSKVSSEFVRFDANKKSYSRSIQGLEGDSKYKLTIGAFQQNAGKSSKTKRGDFKQYEVEVVTESSNFDLTQIQDEQISLRIHSHKGHEYGYPPERVLQSNDDYYLSQWGQTTNDWIVFEVTNNNIYYPTKLQVRVRGSHYYGSNGDPYALKNFRLKMGNDSEIPDIDRKKYLVPMDLSIANFMYVIRKRLRVSPDKGIYLFVNDHLMPTTSALVSQYYEQYKDADGFLYVAYSGESTFG